MWVKRELDIDDLDNFFWSGAKQRWNDATDDQKERVWDLLQEMFERNEVDGRIPTETEVNDFVWFECDDIFNEEETDESRIFGKESCKTPRKLPRKNAMNEAVDMNKPLWEGWSAMDYADENAEIMDMIMRGRATTPTPKTKAELKKVIANVCTPNVPKLQRAVVDYFAKKYNLK